MPNTQEEMYEEGHDLPDDLPDLVEVPAFSGQPIERAPVTRGCLPFLAPVTFTNMSALGQWFGVDTDDSGGTDSECPTDDDTEEKEVHGCSGWGPDRCLLHVRPRWSEREGFLGSLSLANPNGLGSPNREDVAAAFGYFQTHGMFMLDVEISRACALSGHLCQSRCGSTRTPCFSRIFPLDSVTGDNDRGTLRRTPGCEWYHLFLYFVLDFDCDE